MSTRAGAEPPVYVTCMRCHAAVEQPPEQEPRDDFGEWDYRSDFGGWMCGRCAQISRLEDEVSELRIRLREDPDPSTGAKINCASCDRVTSQRAAEGSGAWHPLVGGAWRCPQCVQLQDALGAAEEARAAWAEAEEATVVAHARERWAKTLLLTRLDDVRGLRVGPNDGPIERIFDPEQPDHQDSAEHAFQAVGPRLALFAHVMAWELRQNAHKGDWKDISPGDLVEDLLYHVGKLAVAADELDREAMLEYAADCANIALMVVDVTGALAVEHISPEGASRRYAEKPYAAKLDHARSLAADWYLELTGSTARERQARRLLEQVEFDADGNVVNGELPF